MSRGVARNVHGMSVSQTSRPRTRQSRNLKYNNVKFLYSRSDRLVIQWVGTSAANTYTANNAISQHKTQIKQSRLSLV